MNESPGRPDEPKMAVRHESEPSHTERAEAAELVAAPPAKALPPTLPRVDNKGKVMAVVAVVALAADPVAATVVAQATHP
jgi:hypothetical protein